MENLKLAFMVTWAWFSTVIVIAIFSKMTITIFKIVWSLW